MMPFDIPEIDRDLTPDPDETRDELRNEIREDARRFILDSAVAGVPPMQILDELASFYDGDIIDPFP
jgi:hypothetical protein